VAPYFHWCGTCAMGGEIVDADLKVKGRDNLWVCDASVFPTAISVPTAPTCAGLGRLLGIRLAGRKLEA